MSKLVITLAATKPAIESVSADNPYLSEDGMLNFAKVAKLQERIAKTLKAAEKSEEGPIKTIATYVMKRRAKPVQFRAASDAKGDLKYRQGRAIKIYGRRRVSPEALARVAILLQVPSPDQLDKYKAEVKLAQAAISRHMKKAESTANKVTKEKGKIREAKNAVFEQSSQLLRQELEAAGFKPSDIVEAQGMMGKTVIVRLSPDHYVSVTHADKARFAAATKASKEQA